MRCSRSAARRMAVLSATLLLSSAELSAQDSAAAKTKVGAESELAVALEGGYKLFRSLRSFWRAEVVDPLARAQGARALRQLANSLDDLATQKQDLADAVTLADRRKDFSLVQAPVSELQTTVSVLRSRLNKVFQFIPEAKRVEGGKVEEQLRLGFTTKWESLDAVAKELALPKPSVDAVRKQTAEMVRLTMKMKAQVDALALELQK
ncbi:MAG: hypothetical protein M3081_09005 [Gemmatimonadota bacterium]|nr:hypothetical protein [Gemmatimonadota bacterium]